MNPAEPTGGGIVARVLLAALQWAKSRKNPEISESQFVQIAKVTVLGSNSSVSIGSPGQGVSSEEFDSIVRRCFDAALHQPGLRIAYTVGADGGRKMIIQNIAEFELPDESSIESYTISTSRRELTQGDSTDQIEPPVLEGEIVEPVQEGPSVTNIDAWTGQDYARFTERLLALPDDVDVPKFPNNSAGER